MKKQTQIFFIDIKQIAQQQRALVIKKLEKLTNTSLSKNHLFKEVFNIIEKYHTNILNTKEADEVYFVEQILLLWKDINLLQKNYESIIQTFFIEQSHSFGFKPIDNICRYIENTLSAYLYPNTNFLLSSYEFEADFGEKEAKVYFWDEKEYLLKTAKDYAEKIIQTKQYFENLEFKQNDGAQCILYNKGKILLLKRAADKEIEPGKWNFGGGRIDKNDLTPKKTAAREIMEETNIDISILPKIYINSSIQQWQNQDITLFTYFCNISELKHIDIQINEEHSEYKWIDTDELLDMFENKEIPGYYESQYLDIIETIKFLG